MAVFGVECLKPRGYEDGLQTPLIPYLEEKQHAEKSPRLPPIFVSRVVGWENASSQPRTNQKSAEQHIPTIAKASDIFLGHVHTPPCSLL